MSKIYHYFLQRKASDTTAAVNNTIDTEVKRTAVQTAGKIKSITSKAKLCKSKISEKPKIKL